MCGLREVLKHIKLKRLKCVILPPNLDKIQSEGAVGVECCDLSVHDYILF